MLKRGTQVLVGAALVAILLAVLPAAAEAREGTVSTQDASVVVVRPGDTLWSISAERLGPNATARQIAIDTERIYALNRDRIGASPHLIFAGQELRTLPTPTTMGEPPAGASAARRPAEPAGTRPTDRAAKGVTDRAPGATSGATSGEDEKAPDPAILPKAAAADPVPAVRAPAAEPAPGRSPLESFAIEVRSVVSAVGSAVGGDPGRDGHAARRLLGVALFAVSWTLALVLALRAVVELRERGLAAERRARERWAREVAEMRAAARAALRSGGENAASDDGIPVARRLGNGTHRAEIFAAARRRKAGLRHPVRPRRPARQARNGPADGAYGPDIRRVLRQGRRTVHGEPGDPHPMQEWKIGEPLRSVMGGIPGRPGAPLREALSRVKPLVADELTKVASLERHRALSRDEQRQARALRQFLATMEEVSNDAWAG
jgi:hypothetical protein